MCNNIITLNNEKHYDLQNQTSETSININDRNS